MRVLVVDDSTLFRKIVRDAIGREPGIEVVGSAANGRLALEKIDELRPDVITLDLEMPEIDGLEVLRRLQTRPVPPSVVMISALTSTGATLTARALRLGAFDFVLKPQGDSLEENLLRLRAELPHKLRLAAEARAKSSAVATSIPESSQQAGAAATRMLSCSAEILAPPSFAPEIIAIGVSTGGPAALAEVLPKLPANFPLPVVVVQHMPPLFTRSLAEELDRMCRVHVHEAAGDEPLVAGEVFIAPGGRQMKVVQGANGPQIALTDDLPEKSCKPSVDYLFRSLAELYGSKVLALVMTGMGDDGMLGCQILKRAAARVVAQDEASCVVFGMPRRVVEAGLADVVCPLRLLHEAIFQSVSSGLAPCS
jgi:two-component system, chemotaxis family, protein-glutamate methylesterase/glutaminase